MSDTKQFNQKLFSDYMNSPKSRNPKIVYEHPVITPEYDYVDVTGYHKKIESYICTDMNIDWDAIDSTDEAAQKSLNELESKLLDPLHLDHNYLGYLFSFPLRPLLGNRLPVCVLTVAGFWTPFTAMLNLASRIWTGNDGLENEYMYNTKGFISPLRKHLKERSVYPSQNVVIHDMKNINPTKTLIDLLASDKTKTDFLPIIAVSGHNVEIHDDIRDLVYMCRCVYTEEITLNSINEIYDNRLLIIQHALTLIKNWIDRGAPLFDIDTTHERSMWRQTNKHFSKWITTIMGLASCTEESED